ncbi:MAG: trypsin-like peptidase domain-containing protein [Psychroserpens sp.]|nr:trypsin-like peptidase domain-containing protein [Psychroserpens sp.]
MSPAVVSIFVEENTVVASDGLNSQTVTQNGLGSGFLVADNLVVTAAHVVRVPERIQIQFSDGEIIPGTVLSSYNAPDIALVKLFRPKMNATIVNFGDSDKLKVGQQVFVVGSPYGLTDSFSSGYVSSFRRSNLGSNPFTSTEFIQTDAAINQGNSGGPMFNLQGEVVGIVSHITTQSGGFEGIGYASSSNLAKKLLLDNSRPWLGAEMHLLTLRQGEILNLPQEYCLLVKRVSSNSVFGKMGVKGGDIEAIFNEEKLILGGDIILAFNDIKFDPSDNTLTKLGEFANNLGPNPKFNITIFRKGKKLILESK